MTQDSRREPAGSSRVQQFEKVVQWQHEYGLAHCLARVYARTVSRGPLVIVSEIRSNPDSRGIGGDFGAVADSVLAVLPAEYAASPQNIVWLKHHGEFSSYDAFGAPETFTLVQADWDGEHYRCDIAGMHLMAQWEIDDLLVQVELDPVADVLARLDWRY